MTPSFELCQPTGGFPPHLIRPNTNMDPGRAWTVWATRQLAADAQRSADTHLIPIPVPAFAGVVDVYLKDESVHPSGSLKHRLARSLLLHAIVNGWVREGSVVVECSSGSTAVSEAYFCKLLRLRFVAVMPLGTSPAKVALIERYGGEPHWVPRQSNWSSEAAALAATLPRGHFLDQFSNAERATDWRANNSLASSLFEQLRLEPHPTPAYVVCGAGTGGTSATLGRYVRYHGVASCVVVADPERSALAEFFRTGDAEAARASVAGLGAGRIEGIGRPTAVPSFLRTVIDAVVRVPDAFTIGALLYLERALGRRVGGSTGAIFCTILTLAERMRARGERGSIVGILCDGGDRYADTLFSPSWREAAGIAEECARGESAVEALATVGVVETERAGTRVGVGEVAGPGGGGGAVGAVRGGSADGGSADGNASGSDGGRSGILAPSRLGSLAWPLTIMVREDLEGAVV